MVALLFITNYPGFAGAAQPRHALTGYAAALAALESMSLYLSSLTHRHALNHPNVARPVDFLLGHARHCRELPFIAPTVDGCTTAAQLFCSVRYINPLVIQFPVGR